LPKIGPVIYIIFYLAGVLYATLYRNLPGKKTPLAGVGKLLVNNRIYATLLPRTREGKVKYLHQQDDHLVSGFCLVFNGFSVFANLKTPKPQNDIRLFRF